MLQILAALLLIPAIAMADPSTLPTWEAHPDAVPTGSPWEFTHTHANIIKDALVDHEGRLDDIETIDGLIQGDGSGGYTAVDPTTVGGDDAAVVYTGTNYTEDDATLAGHLTGIDNRLMGISHTAHGSVSTATELSPGSHSLTVGGAFSLTFGDLVETTAYEQSIILRVIGNATHSITWPATVLWSFGVAPTQPFPATLHTIVFKTVDGETIEGYEVGLEMQTVP